MFEEELFRNLEYKNFPPPIISNAINIYRTLSNQPVPWLFSFCISLTASTISSGFFGSSLTSLIGSNFLGSGLTSFIGSNLFGSGLTSFIGSNFFGSGLTSLIGTGFFGFGLVSSTLVFFSRSFLSAT